MDTINDRINEIADKNNLNASNFAREIGLSDSSTISKIMKGVAKPSYVTLSKILTRFDVSADWLLMGKGNMKKGFESHLNVVNKKMTGTEAKEIRESVNVQINDFAQMLGVTKVTIYNNEANDFVSPDYQRRIEKQGFAKDDSLKEENLKIKAQMELLIRLYNVKDINSIKKKSQELFDKTQQLEDRIEVLEKMRTNSHSPKDS